MYQQICPNCVYGHKHPETMIYAHCKEDNLYNIPLYLIRYESDDILKHCGQKKQKINKRPNRKLYSLQWKHGLTDDRAIT